MSVFYFVYLLLIPFFFFDIGSNNIKQKRQILFSFCVFYSLFSGFGYWDTDDWNAYKDYFEQSNWDIFNFYAYGDTKLEFGFVFINVLFKSIFGKFCILMTFISFFWLYENAITMLKYTKYPIIAFTLFFFMGTQFLIIRQHLALALLLMAFRATIEQNFKKFISYVFWAFTIHESSLIFLPVYFIRKIPINYLTANAIYIIVMLLAIAFQHYFLMIGLLFGGSMESKLEIYSDFQNLELERGFITDMFNLIILNLVLYAKHKEQCTTKKTFISLCILCFLICNCIQMVFQNGMNELVRLAASFRIGVIFVWVISLEYFNQHQKKYFNLYIAFILFYLYTKFIGNPLWNIYAKNGLDHYSLFFN